MSSAIQCFAGNLSTWFECLGNPCEAGGCLRDPGGYLFPSPVLTFGVPSPFFIGGFVSGESLALYHLRGFGVGPSPLGFWTACPMLSDLQCCKLRRKEHLESNLEGRLLGLMGWLHGCVDSSSARGAFADPVCRGRDMRGAARRIDLDSSMTLESERSLAMYCDRGDTGSVFPLNGCSPKFSGQLQTPIASSMTRPQLNIGFESFRFPSLRDSIHLESETLVLGAKAVVQFREPGNPGTRKCDTA